MGILTEKIEVFAPVIHKSVSIGPDISFGNGSFEFIPLCHHAVQIRSAKKVGRGAIYRYIICNKSTEYRI